MQQISNDDMQSINNLQQIQEYLDTCQSQPSDDQLAKMLSTQCQYCLGQLDKTLPKSEVVRKAYEDLKKELPSNLNDISPLQAGKIYKDINQILNVLPKNVPPQPPG